MPVVLGQKGFIELQRTSLQYALTTTLDTSDVNTSRKRFSVDFASGSIITGDKLEISTKDGSLTFVNKTNFEKNNSHIQNYKKNWRYGDGGIAIIKKSFFDHENVKNIELF